MSDPKSPEVIGAAYAELRERVSTLLRELPEDAASRPVPHCPKWTVRELAAHLVGVPDDVLNGRLEGVTTEAWTQAQVDRRTGVSLADLADEWNALSAFDGVLPMIPPPTNAQVVFDSVTHEHDLRNAVGMPGGQDSLAIAVAHAWLLDRTSDADEELGAAVAASPASRFDLVRALSGRRTLAQVAELGLDPLRVEAMLENFPVEIVTEPIEG